MLCAADWGEDTIPVFLRSWAGPGPGTERVANLFIPPGLRGAWLLASVLRII
jgi:hypothetical protein